LKIYAALGAVRALLKAGTVRPGDTLVDSSSACAGPDTRCRDARCEDPQLILKSGAQDPWQPPMSIR
ncbi:hypothetical protein AB0H63_30730, partial [Micromonospora echinospora]|uniref:hypothetical protein n=1 Tax=Micromonospora echinospora TaxID=1877 RepID=UPI0033C2E501